jgi:hypothetical protein
MPRDIEPDKARPNETIDDFISRIARRTTTPALGSLATEDDDLQELRSTWEHIWERQRIMPRHQGKQKPSKAPKKPPRRNRPHNRYSILKRGDPNG